MLIRSMLRFYKTLIIFIMSFLFWNCRGAGNKGFYVIMHDLKIKFKFDVMSITEPRVSGVRADRIANKLNFESSSRVEAQGMLRGLWLLWNNSKIIIKILNSSGHFIHEIVDEGNSDA